MKKTEEEKVANTIGRLVADLRLDLEMVGYYLAVILPNVSFNRIVNIVEAGQEQKESHYGRNYI
jgi:hypothetical protein